jgi:hypothetical protein
MMALLPIILFVTTDIYEKVKIRLTIKMNDEKIDMIANVIKSLLAFRVYADNRPKTLRFFTTTLSSEMYCGLHFQFHRAYYYS